MHIEPRHPQAGFVLVALVFLVLVGALLLAGMAFLYGTATGDGGLQNGGGQAFVAAESADQYGVYYLETNYWGQLPPASLTLPAQTPSLPNPGCPPVVTVTQTATDYYAVAATAVCAASGARWQVTRVVYAQVRKKPKFKHGQLKKPGRITYAMVSWAQQ